MILSILFLSYFSLESKHYRQVVCVTIHDVTYFSHLSNFIINFQVVIRWRFIFYFRRYINRPVGLINVNANVNISFPAPQSVLTFWSLLALVASRVAQSSHDVMDTAVMRKLEDVILSRVTGVSVKSCDAPGRKKITDFPGKFFHISSTSLDARCSCMCSDHAICIHSQIKIILLVFRRFRLRISVVMGSILVFSLLLH
jgi:hypothetical protein